MATRSASKYARLIAQVKARGENKCYRCKQAIDWRIQHPNPNAPTLEHIKPVSMYPLLEYDPINCTVSHAYCNTSAGNKAEHVTATTSRRW